MELSKQGITNDFLFSTSWIQKNFIYIKEL